MRPFFQNEYERRLYKKSLTNSIPYAIIKARIKYFLQETVMEIKCMEPIIQSLNNERPIGKVSLCFGDDIIRYNTFNENKIKSKKGLTLQETIML